MSIFKSNDKFIFRLKVLEFLNQPHSYKKKNRTLYIFDMIFDVKLGDRSCTKTDSNL